MKKTLWYLQIEAVFIPGVLTAQTKGRARPIQNTKLSVQLSGRCQLHKLRFEVQFSWHLESTLI